MNSISTSLGRNYIDLWKENMKEWDGTLSNRMINDEAEDAFWNAFLEKKQQNGTVDTNAYAHIIREELLKLLHESDHVLEIGPGWGNYTFCVSEHVKQLTCVDISQSIIDFLKHKTEKMQLNNISFIHEKWEQLNIKQTCDVVFGINCYYRIRDIDKALLKMNQAASRLVIAGMTSGPEKPHYIDLHREHGYSIKFRRRDYIDLQNILYQLGIMANCRIIEIPRVSIYESFEALIRDNVSKILTRDYNQQEVEQALSRYVVEKNGQYEYSYTIHAALLYWKPVNI
ncbi:class I SAM-dependent methyltransferase [Pseudobacillus sp. FSL P4-0506]|uniref:class I SAM-dependent methyltransferase n=1 Tax=Pseudobacillus sp. FSL P4-0506 TaxID=2921576 RepID=UPI0030FA2BF2